jgi:hypothetical protein
VTAGMVEHTTAAIEALEAVVNARRGASQASRVGSGPTP